MNGLALLGIICILYAIGVIFLTIKKPPKIWKMKKIQLFEKALGVKGTEIFFYVFAIAVAVLGVWLMAK